jgi:hypothetical protein
MSTQFSKLAQKMEGRFKFTYKNFAHLLPIFAAFLAQRKLVTPKEMPTENGWHESIA